MVVSALIGGFSPISWAQTVFVGPSPYLSREDIPPGFYLNDTPAALEDFEDGSLDFGITASNGATVPPGFIGLIDSVDGDDGVIDGSGLLGHSWFYGAGATGVVFTFSAPLPTAAGVVWTDGGGTTTFEAFGPGMLSLGTIGPVAIADSSNAGTTAEDRFFGALHGDGILAIKVSNTSGGIELDHVQYGTAGSLYSGSILGDMDDNGVFDAFDVDEFELALADQGAYIALFPPVDPDQRGDMNGSGALDAFDVAPFEQALAGGGMSIPEPTTLVGLGLMLTFLARQRSRATRD